MTDLQSLMTTARPSIAICGGGIAGLALATLLARNGFKPVVFEARGELAARREGAFLTIAPNGLAALRPLGVMPDGILTRAIEIANHRGRLLATIDQRDGEGTAEGSVTIERGVLAGQLIDAARHAGVDLRFDKRVTGATESAQNVTLAFGTEHLPFDFVVAADGLGSALRQAIFPTLPRPRYTGLVGTGGVGYVPEVPSTDGTMRMVFGRRAFFGYQKQGDGPVYWFNSHPVDEAELSPVDDPVAYVDRLRALHEGDPEPIGRILAAVPAIERAYPINDMPPLATWHSRRVVLLGDAAHAVSPHAGQGASMALEDAVVLAACLDETLSPTAAFARFEGLRRKRTRKVMEIARRNGGRKMAQSPLALFLRDLLLPLLNPLGRKTAHRIMAFRVDRTPLAVPPAI